MISNERLKVPSMNYPATYRIRIKGHLDTSWMDRLGGMTITTTQGKGPPAITILKGKLHDQAALTGVINTLYDLQFPLISVECLDCVTSTKEGKKYE